MTHTPDFDMRSIVIQFLKSQWLSGSSPHWGQIRVSSIGLSLGQYAREKRLTVNGGQQAWRNDDFKLVGNLAIPARDAIFELIHDRVLTYGFSGDVPTLDYIRPTEFGKAVIAGETTPYDPDDYVKRIQESVPNVHPVILDYITESAETLRRNCLLSSTVMLGCACEKLFLLLIDAVSTCITGTAVMALASDIAVLRSLKQKHERFENFYRHHLKRNLKLHPDHLSGFDDAIHLVFNYFRDMRNDAGHPTGKVLSRTEVYGHLILFPHYLQNVYRVIDWLQANRPLSI